MPASKVKIDAIQEGTEFLLNVEFANGERRSYTLQEDDPLMAQFALYGFNKKVRDTVSNSGTTDEAVQNVDILLQAFGRGEWNAQRNSEGESHIGVLAQAMMQLYRRTAEDCTRYVGTLSKKQQADLRAVPEIAEAIHQSKASKKQAEPAQAALDLLKNFTEAGTSDKQAVSDEGKVREAIEL